MSSCAWDLRGNRSNRPRYQSGNDWRDEAYRLKARLNDMDARLREMDALYRRRIDQILEGIGGAVWKTAEGHARGIALLSSEHLWNIMKLPLAGYGIITKCQAELDRRSIDEAWRGKDFLFGRILKKSRPKAKPKPKRKPAKRIRQPIPKYKPAKKRRK